MQSHSSTFCRGRLTNSPCPAVGNLHRYFVSTKVCPKKSRARKVQVNSAQKNNSQQQNQAWLASYGWSLVLPLLPCLPAKAEDLDEAITTVKSGNPDWLISAAFTTAILALGAVTLGVAYLAFLTWNDKRTEAAERKEFEQVLKDRELSKKYDGSIKPNKPKKKKGETKGFG